VLSSYFLPNVKGHASRADAENDHKPSSASHVPTCSGSSLRNGVVAEEDVLGDIEWEGGKLIHHLIPNLTEPEKAEARKKWMGDAERRGGVENLLWESPGYGAGLLSESSREWFRALPGGQSEYPKQ